MVMIRPIDLPRSLAGKAPIMMAMPVPWVIAAPVPCTMRARISTSNWVAVPAAIAPATVTKDPMMYTRFEVMRSASRPMGNSSAMMVMA